MLGKEMLNKYIHTSTIHPFRFLKTTLRELTFDVYILSDDKKKITYITSSDIIPYIIKIIYGNDDVSITKIRRIYAYELKKFADRQDAVLIDMHKYFARFFDDGFLVPPFVRQVTYVDRSTDKTIKMNDSDLRKMRKYSYEISNDLNALKFFYKKMYTPYIKRRYADSAYIKNFNDLEKILKNGELIFIKLDGEYVSGALCEINDNVYYCRKNGVLDESFIKEGALAATYYFSVLRAKEKDVKIVDFGQSRPFLSDGVLRHKSHWGAKICEDKTIDRIIYLRNIFEQPFIYIEDKKLKAAVFSENDKLIKEHARSGLEFNIIDKTIEKNEIGRK